MEQVIRQPTDTSSTSESVHLVNQLEILNVSIERRCLKSKGNVSLIILTFREPLTLIVNFCVKVP